MLTSLRHCAPGKKSLFRPGSKALQDQLYSRDLPTVAKALAFTGKTALLKGRSNYLCLERLEQQALAGGDLPVQTLSDVILLRSWVKSDAGWRYQHLRQRGGGFPGLGRWSPVPTTTALAAIARSTKSALW
ncbi:ATP-dependent helicase [Salmonella enterica subsp. enterica]|nr:ATP-dependent helicase [Salmonella enterica subsp. enterica] [Salmonella enterica subsp. enterica serovar Menston]